MRCAELTVYDPPSRGHFLSLDGTEQRSMYGDYNPASGGVSTSRRRKRSDRIQNRRKRVKRLTCYKQRPARVPTLSTRYADVAGGPRGEELKQEHVGMTRGSPAASASVHWRVCRCGNRVEFFRRRHPVHTSSAVGPHVRLASADVRTGPCLARVCAVVGRGIKYFT